MGPLGVLDKAIDVAEATSSEGASTMGADEAKEAARDVVEAFGEHIKEKHDLATYGVDSETVDELRAMEGGEEVLGRMAERRDAAREAAADKIGDKIPKIGYVRGEAVNSALMAAAGGASAAIGDALDVAQAGVSNMFDVVNDFASERTAMAKDALAGVKDVVAEADSKAIDTGVEL